MDIEYVVRTNAEAEADNIRAHNKLYHDDLYIHAFMVSWIAVPSRRGCGYPLFAFARVSNDGTGVPLISAS